ncbi:MAG: methyl-accepting chemotaxis protein [Pseudolabrys sp.]
MKTIKAKMFTAFAFLIIAMMGIGGAGWYAAKVANDGLYTVFKDRVEPLRDLKIVSDLYAVNIVDATHKVRSGSFDWAQGQKAVLEATTGIAKYWKAYSETYMEADERALAQEASRLMQASDHAVKELADILQAKDKQRLDRFTVEKLYPSIDPTTEAIGKLVDLQIKVAEQQYASSSEQFAYARAGMVATFVFASLVLAAFLFIVAVQVLKPVAALTTAMRALAGGDFTVVFPAIRRKDEIGDITRAAGEMATQVRSTISGIKQSAMEVNSASGEISTSTTDLSQRTEEQAASLEETTAAMEEISAAVKKSADNADQANRSAGQARHVAGQGGEVVAKAVDAMAKIEESSRKISDIIGVIDEIARQTNLLALNAAVEAARAGEAGRGFAVVASEVRSLAQRSSQAAKDIKELITNSNGQVQEGVELVNSAGKSLANIVESVREVAELVDDIARASTEQATGLEQINKALLQMDEVTQQNAALVEENAATAKALETQAQSMDEQVAFFRVDAAAPSVLESKGASKPAGGVSAPSAATRRKAA